MISVSEDEQAFLAATSISNPPRKTEVGFTQENKMSREQAFARSFLSLVSYIPMHPVQDEHRRYAITKFNYKIADRALNVLGIMSYC